MSYMTGSLLPAMSSAVHRATAIPYSDAPSSDALYGTAVEAREVFWVKSKLLQPLQEVKPVAGRPYDCLGV